MCFLQLLLLFKNNKALECFVTMAFTAVKNKYVFGKVPQFVKLSANPNHTAAHDGAFTYDFASSIQITGPAEDCTHS